MSHGSTILRETVSDMPYVRLENDVEDCDSDNLQANGDMQEKLLGQSSKKENQTIRGSLDDEKYDAVGYKKSWFLVFMYHLCGSLTGGFIYLIAYWRPDWKVYWKKKKSSLKDADTLILTDIDSVTHVVNIEVEEMDNIPEEYVAFGCTNAPHTSAKRIRFFVFQYLKYVWNSEKSEFQCLVGVGKDTLTRTLLQNFRGYTPQQYLVRERLFGKNCITIQVKSYLLLLFTEVLNPFYIFQIASLILWASDEYYLYAICIFIISCLSISVSLFETRKQSENLKSMVEASNASHVWVLRTPEDLDAQEVEAVNLVPGDVIVIPSTGGVMACDAVLISGNAIVNESMLTGESVPITKTPLTCSDESEVYSPEKHKRHTLFCGTNVIQTRYYGKDQVLAIVVRTGFNTAKGELVRSILYPRSIDFKFYKDSIKFIGFLFFVSLIGMSYSLYLHITRSKPIMTTIVRTLDIVTIVVPPALPAAMTVGTYYSQNRLKKLGIFCISPPRINVCGKMKLVCFDKTGTLTEDGLEVWGVVGVEKTSDDVSAGLLGRPCHQIHLLDYQSYMMAALASCHSLTYINGQLTGDPLDIQMFESTKWELVEPEKENEIFDSLIPTIVRPSSKLLLSPYSAPKPVSNEGHDQSDSGPTRTSDEGNDNSKCFNEGGLNLSGGVGGVGDSRGVDTRTESSAPDGKKPGVEGEERSRVGNEAESKEDSQPSLTVEQVPYEIGIVRQFPFSSSTQRMSVIVRVLGKSHMDLYCKGAPEVIQHLCKSDSIPENLHSVLTQFTIQGFRVIALAHKSLDHKLSWHNVQRVKRKQIECDMTFLGLLILQNVLKPETSPVIRELKHANIRTVMVTGDNILTGICVGRDCGMVGPKETVLLAKVTDDEGGGMSLSFETAHSGGLEDSAESNQHSVILVEEKHHLAVTGSVWGQIRESFPDLIPYVVSSGTIFGRMSPDQKVQLVEELQKLDYIVGMCGDGANDCGALKAAHVGISLSEAEASVAAPFTSKVPNITCVPKVICEGRGALTTNFSVFKYMALYSIIQFVSVLILYSSCTNLSDPQFLYIDLFIVTLVAVFMGYTKAKHELVPKRPLSNLIGIANLFSVSAQITLVILMQVFTFYYLRMQPWYSGPSTDCDDPESDNKVDTWETNVIFCVSSFQYLSLGIIYSPGHPFREPLYTNVWLVSTIGLFVLTSMWLLLWPLTFLETLMNLKTFPDGHQVLFRGTLFGIVLLHFILGWSVEYFVAGSDSLKTVFRCMSRKKTPKNLYKRVRNQMANDPKWPPLSEPIFSSVTS